MVKSKIQQMFSIDSVDFTETRIFLLGFAQVVLSTISFILIFWVIAALQLATLDPTPESTILPLLLGICPALVLGAGLPYLIQYWGYMNQINSLIQSRVLWSILTFGMYTLFMFYNPVSSLIFALVYIVSRIIVLIGIYSSPHLKKALN